MSWRWNTPPLFDYFDVQRGTWGSETRNISQEIEPQDLSKLAWPIPPTCRRHMDYVHAVSVDLMKHF